MKVEEIPRQDDRVRKLRHDLANPLSAILAEAQLLLLDVTGFDQETQESLRHIEALSRRMKDILAKTRIS